MKTAIGHKIAVGFAGALLVMAVIGVFAYRSTTEFVWDAGRAAHSRRILGELKELLSQAQDLEVGARGFVVTGNEEYLEPYLHASETIARQEAILTDLIASDDTQRSRLEAIKPLVAETLAFSRRTIELRKNDGFEAASAWIRTGRGKRVMDDIRGAVAAIEATESERLDRQDKLGQTRGQRTVLVVAVGSLLGLVVVGLASGIIHRDLTRRKIVEAERDGFFTLSLDLLCIADAEGHFKRLNPAWEVLGYGAEELTAKPYVEFVHPDDREATIAETAKLAAGATTTAFENRYRAKDGSYRWLLWKARLSPDGQSIYATARDITERRQAESALRQAEERLRLLVEGVKDYAVFMLDPTGHVASWNSGAKRIKGYDADEIVGQHMSRFYPAEDVRNGKPAMELKTATETGRYEEEGWRVRKDGSVFWASVVLTAVRDEAGQLRGFAKVTRDVTERKRAEDDIRSLNRALYEHGAQLEAANKELEAFCYSVSHDLRAPLRGIDGFSQALLEDYADKLDDDGKDALRRVRAATQRMGQLIDDMLNLSRVTRGEMRHETVDLTAAANAVVADLRKANSGRAVDVMVRDGLTARGDSRLLRIVLDNLIGNAWKFTGRRDNARIEVGTTADGAYFVRDNGAGFDMAYAQKLFAAFQRLHAANEFAGTGIGLATVARVVYRHGGRVWAEGEVGRGATFFFTIPTDGARAQQAA